MNNPMRPKNDIQNDLDSARMDGTTMKMKSSMNGTDNQKTSVRKREK